MTSRRKRISPTPTPTPYNQPIAPKNKKFRLTPANIPNLLSSKKESEYVGTLNELMLLSRDSDYQLHTVNYAAAAHISSYNTAPTPNLVLDALLKVFYVK